ncbi:hypothetical protein SOVF_191780 [Spinacia oleracea]|nr:hypothetical protein SOVF_191780 [Spinacia oleracea]
MVSGGSTVPHQLHFPKLSRLSVLIFALLMVLLSIFFAKRP